MKTLAGIPKHIVAAGTDMAIGLVLFCLIVSLVGVEPGGQAVTPLRDLVAISANAADIGEMPDYSTTATRAADVVRSAVPVPQNPASLFGFTDQTSAMWMLAAIFSALFAFNLSFLRHLRRQHAPARDGQRRRRR